MKPYGVYCFLFVCECMFVCVRCVYLSMIKVEVYYHLLDIMLILRELVRWFSSTNFVILLSLGLLLAPFRQ